MEQADYSGEVWRQIKNADNFLVSNFGRVKSKGRKIRYEHHSTGEEHFRQTEDVILKSSLTKYGYPFVNIRFDSGVKKNCMIHRLVADAFIPNPNNYPVVNHKDGVKTNNYKENLEWCTCQYNSKHAIRIGAKQYGSKAHNSVLDENLVELLKIKMALGFTLSELSREYGINHVTLSNIKNKKSWIHVAIPDGIKPIKGKYNKQRKIPVYQINVRGDIVRKFPSLLSVAKEFGLTYSEVQKRILNPSVNNNDGLNFMILTTKQQLNNNLK